METITPTVGRIVLFHSAPGTPEQASIITEVHSDRLISVTVFPTDGPPEVARKVPLQQPEDDEPTSAHCKWMPYQIKKTTGSESGEEAAGTKTV